MLSKNISPEDDLLNLMWWPNVIVLSQLLMDEHHVSSALRHFELREFWIVKHEKLRSDVAA
jgi:hypothetical protein